MPCRRSSAAYRRRELHPGGPGHAAGDAAAAAPACVALSHAAPSPSRRASTRVEHQGQGHHDHAQTTSVSRSASLRGVERTCSARVSSPSGAFWRPAGTVNAYGGPASMTAIDGCVGAEVVVMPLSRWRSRRRRGEFMTSWSSRSCREGVDDERGSTTLLPAIVGQRVQSTSRADSVMASSRPTSAARTTIRSASRWR